MKLFYIALVLLSVGLSRESEDGQNNQNPSQYDRNSYKTRVIMDKNANPDQYKSRTLDASEQQQNPSYSLKYPGKNSNNKPPVDQLNITKDTNEKATVQKNNKYIGYYGVFICIGIMASIAIYIFFDRIKSFFENLIIGKPLVMSDIIIGKPLVMSDITLDELYKQCIPVKITFSSPPSQKDEIIDEIITFKKANSAPDLFIISKSENINFTIEQAAYYNAKYSKDHRGGCGELYLRLFAKNTKKDNIQFTLNDDKVIQLYDTNDVLRTYKENEKISLKDVSLSMENFKKSLNGQIKNLKSMKNFTQIERDEKVQQRKNDKNDIANNLVQDFLQNSKNQGKKFFNLSKETTPVDFAIDALEGLRGRIKE